MSRQLRTPEQLKEFQIQSRDQARHAQALEDEVFNKLMDTVELLLASGVFPCRIELSTCGQVKAYNRMLETIATGYQIETRERPLHPVSRNERLLTIIRPWGKDEQRGEKCDLIE